MSDLRLDFTDEHGCYYYARRTLPDGRVGEVYPLTFGRARLGVRQADDFFGYDENY